ncbi:MAG TPA: T9SS type A sorting domain-containing protein, partial [Bacteroidetes bacterium]|nr:T9SS type A sorting domain-containing protein [Bacteroidota bacterium]
GNAIIAGDSGNSTVVAQYDTEGNVMWERVFKDNPTGANRPLGIIEGGGEIYVTSTAKGQAGNTYSTFKLSTLEHPQVAVLEQGVPSHIEGDVLVRFKPGVISTSFIDDKNFQYGKIGDIVNDPSCLTAIANKLSAKNFSDWVAVKAYKNMTTADSLAVTRLGKTIRVSDFYNTFLLTAPDWYTSIQGERQLADTLNSKDLQCCIRYAGINNILHFECGPNDPLYPQQAGLHPTPSYNADINIEPAWCAGAGSPDVKVAFTDSGIRWSHEDFGDGTFDGSVVVDGKNYLTGEHISTNNENDGANHGTKVAGIIGAIRNNSKGIAGVAGGTGAADGVRLVGLKGTTVLHIIEMLYDAADVYGVQIINMSVSWNPSEPLSANDPAFRDALHHVNRMGVIVCAARGNVTTPGQPTDVPKYPASAQDEWVLTVGGTGTTGIYNFDALTGHGIDIAAPAHPALTVSTSATGDQAYGDFGVTSAAAAYTSGVIALMLSSMMPSGTQLTQEDIEYILQASATDIESQGYDDKTGFGRVDAGAALQMIQGPACSVHHFGTDTNPNNKTNVLVEAGVTMTLYEPFTTEGGQTFDAGPYTADIYKVTATVSHSLPSGAAVTHFWERHSSSTVFKFPEGSATIKFLDPVEHVTFVGTPTTTTATLEGYVYYLKNSSCSIEGWIPSPPEDAELTYSLISCLQTGTEETGNEKLKLFPNPSSDLLTLSIPGAGLNGRATVAVYDVSGKQVIAEMGVDSALNGGLFTFDTGHLPQGVYTCVVRSDHEVITGKFIRL